MSHYPQRIKDYQRFLHDRMIQHKKCFYLFMRECYGCEGDVYPSDMLVDWTFHEIDCQGNVLELGSHFAAGITISSSIGNHSMNIFFNDPRL